MGTEFEADHEAGAAQKKQAGQGDDEGLDLAKVDDQALKGAEGHAEGDQQRSRRQGMPSEGVEMRHDDADEADHRTDREVDAAGKDDESRPRSPR